MQQSFEKILKNTDTKSVYQSFVHTHSPNVWGVNKLERFLEISNDFMFFFSLIREKIGGKPMDFFF
jgi:hypothetical protein